MRWRQHVFAVVGIAVFCASHCLWAQGAGDLPTPGNAMASGVATPGASSAGAGYDGSPVNPALPVRVFVDHPKPDALLHESSVDVRVRVDNYLLREGGNRLQVVLDNRRSVLVYETAGPITFTNLMPGGHLLRVFAVAGDGRFAPGDGAFASMAFHSLKQGVDNIPEANEPVLSVSSPRGIYEANAAGLIVFDYRIHGVALSPNGYRLRFLVDGRERITHEGGPVLLPALGSGTHRLVAEVVDMDDVAVPGIYSRVGTTFEVKGLAPAATDAVPVLPLRP